MEFYGWNSICKRKDCLRMKEYVGWTSSRLTICLLNLRKPHIFEAIRLTLDKCQTKSFEGMNILIKAILKFCTTNPLFTYLLPQVVSSIISISSNISLKPHLHGRHLAARIDILSFFFLKSRRSLTRRKIHARYSLRDIARHAPKKNQIAAVTHTGGILTRCSHTIATRRSHLHVETTCH